MKCLLDMDGVIADFVKGVCESHRLESPYANPTSWGIFDMEKLWGMSADEFWKPTNDNPRFWYELAPTRDSAKIVDLACKVFGESNIGILSSPSYDPHCIPGKRDWIKRHYPFLEKKMVFANDKSLIASPNTVLIDDRDKNVEDYFAAGGQAVRVPRLWNKDWSHANSFKLLEERVMRFA